MTDIPPQGTVDNPLSTAQLQELDDAISAGESVKPLIQRAIAAGIDLGNLPTEIDESIQRARQIKNVFNP